MTEVEVTPAPALAWQNATLTRITPLTARARSFVLATPQPMAFRAGQHVHVRLTAPDGYRAQRSYSIASAPDETGGIELMIERLADGEVSPFFHDVAQVGDEIELRGPIGGHFVWEPEDGGPVLLLGGGSGIAPLISMARERARRGSSVPMLLLLSSRTWDEAIYRDELGALAARGDGFAFRLALTREPALRAGDYGRRVDAGMVAELLGQLPAPPKAVFICGSNPFVNAATAGLEAAGVADSRVRTERYGPS